MSVPDILVSLAAGAGAVGNIVSGSQEAAANRANLELQKQQLEYQKMVQGRTWEREDTAVQRRVADLRAAGLSPVLAAGSAAQSSPAQVLQAPQQNPQSAGAVGRGVSQGMQTMLALNQAAAVVSRTKAEERLLDMQARKAAADAALTEARVPYGETLASEESRLAGIRTLTEFERLKVAQIERAVQDHLFDTRLDGSRLFSGDDLGDSVLVRERVARVSREIALAALAGHEEKAYNLLKGLGAGNETVRTILAIIQSFMGRR